MTGPNHHAEMEAHYASGLERQERKLESYRTLAERCEILAAALDDRGEKQDAQLLWDADAYIREIEAENAQFHRHACRFPTMGHMLNAPARIADLEAENARLSEALIKRMAEQSV